VVDQAATPDGAERLRSTITEARYGGEMLGDLDRLLDGGTGTETLLASGGRLLSSLFGNRTDALTEAVAGAGGLRRGSTSTLLRLVAPIVMSVVGRQVVSRGLDATGLASMLVGERADTAPKSSLAELDSFLSDTSSGSTPRSFTLDNLNFETGSTRLTATSQQTVSSLAGILKSHSGAQVRLEGHTDATGAEPANKKLSMDRAQAVKRMLVSDGVPASRVDVAGYGSEHPVASNDTDEERAQNRRTDLVVTAR
jgi:outer membrane protein OmpA-like peptidoglycan-associated protein